MRRGSISLLVNKMSETFGSIRSEFSLVHILNHCDEAKGRRGNFLIIPICYELYFTESRTGRLPG